MVVPFCRREEGDSTFNDFVLFSLKDGDKQEETNLQILEALLTLKAAASSRIFFNSKPHNLGYYNDVLSALCIMKRPKNPK